MSNENPQIISLHASDIGIGSYIINDYLLTVAEAENGYTLTIKKGTEVQTASVLNGEKGDKGDPGEKGDKGDPGITVSVTGTRLDII